VQGDQWFEYYRHYSREATGQYNNTVVIKADDDVIYWDVDAFENFIRRRIAHPEVSDTSCIAFKHCAYFLPSCLQYLAIFPGIINNGVAAHYMQKFQVLPDAASPLGDHNDPTHSPQLRDTLI
jgi:hypothetical protein